MEPVNLYQISEEVLDSLSAKANERHINLHLLGEPAYITGNHALKIGRASCRERV